jgi:hypothetical protein
MFGAIRTLDDKRVSSMTVKMHLFADAATARAYIKGLASRFEYPDDLSALLSACDIARAVLAYCLIQEISYYRVMEANYVTSTNGQPDFKNDIITVFNKHRQASVEFEHVKQSLKGIISKLDDVSIL